MVNVFEKFSAFISSARRVLVIARKPTMQEYSTMAKVTGLGIIIIAALAYVIYLIFAFIPI